jgi:protocatechuate 3,4-dioxygenase beta subunit
MLVRDLSRRSFLHGLTGGSLAAFTTPGLFAQQLVDTGTTTEGPFYPDVLPLDTDNDLLVINDSITPAVGDITHLTGRVLTRSGQPVRNAFVEIRCSARPIPREWLEHVTDEQYEAGS